MRRLRYLIANIIFLCLVLSPNFSYAAEVLQNTGLIPSNIWFSKDPFYTGDRIRIYSVIFNGSDKDLKGRINFYDNKALLCTSEFSSLAGRVSEVWCDWTAKAGKNSISVEIVNPRASVAGESEQDVKLANGELYVSDRLVVSAPKVALVPAEQAVINNPVAANQSAPAPSLMQKVIDLVNPAKPVASPAVQNNSPILKTGSKISSKGGAWTNSNVANVYSALSAVKDYFYNFIAWLEGLVLPWLKSGSESANKPLAYVMLFFYTLVKFILDIPALFASIIIAVVWKAVSIYLDWRSSYGY